MTSLFRCPLCSAALTKTQQAYLCPNGHSFDIAREGYTHLLPANKKHSKNPGDDKAMVAARSAFLDSGCYAPLRGALAHLAAQLTDSLPSPALLDSGCGEGYYTAGLYRTLTAAGRLPRVAGVDLSKAAVKRAAKRLPQGEFAVASVYHLPVPDRCIHLLTNVFSPLAAEEFARVLVPGGHFLYVVPSARHLWEMKQVLYQHPYENPVKTEDYSGFIRTDCRSLRLNAHLSDPAHIMALFGMTPYAWKTPKEGIERLRALTQLDTQIGFDIHVYQRLSD